jgi:hypothetical protein
MYQSVSFNLPEPVESQDGFGDKESWQQSKDMTLV